MERKLQIGHKCKACPATLTRHSIDVELCNECMEVVMDYNKDLIDELSATEMVEHL